MPQLYFVRLLVTPDPSHPHFWEAQQACLEVCLWAESTAEADASAHVFARLARWECPDELPPLRVEILDAKRTLKPWAEEARRSGFAFQVFATRLGDDPALPDFAP